jgi:hypothetical protein
MKTRKSAAPVVPPVAEALGETDPAKALLNPDASEPVKSAVEVATDLTESAAPAKPVLPNLFVWSGFQYGCEVIEKGVSLFVPALANGQPKPGDLCTVDLGEGSFSPRKVQSAKEHGDRLELTLVSV